MTYASIQYSFKSSDSLLYTKVYCYFNKTTSWVQVKSDVGLIHEQGHFNIAELFARKLRKAFKHHKFAPLTVRQNLKSIFQSIINDKKTDDIYDRETDFSRNIKMQEYWNKKIAQELKKLEQFKSS